MGGARSSGDSYSRGITSTNTGPTRAGAASSDYVLPPNPAWAPFQMTRTVLLPDRLFDEHDLARSQCSMGLLPEIERAWVTVDHRLLLWDWSDGSSFSTFEELTDVIIGVGLVRPRAGVFVDAITYILVLTTPKEVILVGLGYVAPSPGTKPEVTFYLTGISAPTDGISLTTIRGTSSGRIFLSSSPEPLTPGGIGGDGCLYELVYRSAEGWFDKRCTLYNLTSGSLTRSVLPTFLRGLTAIAMPDWIVAMEMDNDRALLYTLLRNGTIHMYQIPNDGGAPNRVAKTGDVLRLAQSLCPGIPMLNPGTFRIVAMEVISLKEGGNAKVGLVAITSTGVRLYFSHQRRGYGYYPVSNQLSALELCHVRPPPTPAAPQPILPPQFYNQQVQVVAPAPAAHATAFNSIIQARYSSGGLFLASNNLADDLDVLLLAAPDVAAAARAIAEGSSNASTVGSTTRPYAEVAGTIDISGRTWAMAEITPISLVQAVGGTALNELATQATQPRRRWVVLTNMGANVVVRQRPVDTLREVLEGINASGNGAHGEVGVFFESYGRDQSCAMLLTIAAGNSRLSAGESTMGYSSGSNAFANPRAASGAVVEHAKALFFEGGGRPVSVDRGGFGTGQQGMVSDSKIIYSGRHEGLAFYFARLVRPIWKQRITRMSVPGVQVANVSEAVLLTVQRDLISLQAFVEQEQQLFTLLPDGGRSAPLAIAYTAEQQSLSALRTLLTQSVEAIAFILLLISYDLSSIIASCAPATQSTLLSMSYQDLLRSKNGRDVARTLVSAVINQHIERQLSVDAISDTLMQRCGTFCTADDVVLCKAIEAIRRAKDATNQPERLDSLRESLRLFTRATKHVTLERLSQVCAEYTDMHYFLGIVDLSLACAQSWDPTDRAVSYWLEGTPPNDTRSVDYALRRNCNDLVFKGLNSADEVVRSAAQAAPGSKNVPIAYEEAVAVRTNAYNKALSIPDEFFHSFLYDRYLSLDTTDELLSTRTPYLESYLSRDALSLQKSDLLWQYYVRTSRYAEAASVLSRLADDTSLALSIHQRVEYVSLAVSNLKSQLPSSSRGEAVEFLTTCEEKLEVAQVQIEIYGALVSSEDLDDGAKHQVLERLGMGLYTISDLYAEFAEPYELWEMVLLILHVSDHHDTNLVLSAWSSIINKINALPPAARQDALTAKIISLGSRFHSSDIVFPLHGLIMQLETYGYTNRPHLSQGWLPVALHSAGVSYASMFDIFDDMFSTQAPPWHQTPTLLYLLGSLTSLLESWLTESTSLSTTPLDPFPATRVDSAVGKYLMLLQSLGEEEGLGKRLGEVRGVIRRVF